MARSVKAVKNRDEESCLVCSRKLAMTGYPIKIGNGQTRYACNDCNRVLIILRPANHKFSTAEIQAVSHAMSAD